MFRKDEEAILEWSVEHTQACAVRQMNILDSAVRMLKDGGRLVYSTCTLNPKENSEICDRFLAEHPDFEAVEVLPEIKRYKQGDKYLTLMPHIHSTDGFFIAAFIKK